MIGRSIRGTPYFRTPSLERSRSQPFLIGPRHHAAPHNFFRRTGSSRSQLGSSRNRRANHSKRFPTRPSSGRGNQDRGRWFRTCSQPSFGTRRAECRRDDSSKLQCDSLGSNGSATERNRQWCLLVASSNRSRDLESAGHFGRRVGSTGVCRNDRITSRCDDGQPCRWTDSKDDVDREERSASCRGSGSQAARRRTPSSLANTQRTWRPIGF